MSTQPKKSILTEKGFTNDSVSFRQVGFLCDAWLRPISYLPFTSE